MQSEKKMSGSWGYGKVYKVDLHERWRLDGEEGEVSRHDSWREDALMLGEQQKMEIAEGCTDVDGKKKKVKTKNK